MLNGLANTLKALVFPQKREHELLIFDYQLLHKENLNDYSNLKEFDCGILCFEQSSILNYVVPGLCITKECYLQYTDGKSIW